MKLKGITDEDFVNYKVPSMFIATATCSFKCDQEYGAPICQNGILAKQPTLDIPVEQIIDRYLKNPITHAIVLGGLEPLDSVTDDWDTSVFCYGDDEDLYGFLQWLRWGVKCEDDVVIYTGYNKDEIEDHLNAFKTYAPIVVKYGRYIPGQKPHFDPILGVMLASDNQYAERING